MFSFYTTFLRVQLIVGGVFSFPFANKIFKNSTCIARCQVPARNLMCVTSVYVRHVTYVCEGQATPIMQQHVISKCIANIASARTRGVLNK